MTALTETVLAGLMADAIEAMVAMGFDAARLAEVHYAIVDLAGATLAQTLDTTIYFDVNAAGYGWSTDGTTRTGLIDLKSAIMHELGHVVGLDHTTPSSTRSWRPRCRP